MEELSGFAALERFQERLRKGKDARREVRGDLLGVEKSQKAAGKEGLVLFPAFSSLFQGDHLGVEFALCAHQNLLQSNGLLVEDEQIRGKHVFPAGPHYSGLIIDDYFFIGREPLRMPPLHSAAARALACAREVYDSQGLLGSVEKDVEASTNFKAAGAEVISDMHAVKSGFVSVAAPVAKRLALSALSLRAAALPGLSPRLVSRLVGNWTSVLMYRRCLCSIVDGLFALGVTANEGDSGSVLPLPRSLSQELVVLSVLAPLMSSNAAVSYSGTCFASDASLAKGAVVEAEIRGGLCEDLWLASDKRGHYSLLDNGAREILRHLGEDFECDPPPLPLVKPKASPLLYFDFVEICGGVGAVSGAATGLGLVVAPPLDLSASRHYDLTNERLLEWVIHMIAEGRFKSFLLEPPCTTFSPAAYPCLRSYKEPYGFCRENPRVIHGNCLAFRSLVLLRVGRRYRRPCGLEQPRRSKMAWLSEWISLVESGDFEEAVVAACMFGSPHQKEFRFLVHLLEIADLEKRCSRDHTHVRIQGKYTKNSAIYTPELGLHLAIAFKNALRREANREEPEWSLAGLESVLSNDVMLSSSWREVASWFWKRAPHINVLEVSSAVRVLLEAGKRGAHARFLAFVDSSVARGALAKGRSTSRLLQPLLKRACVIQVCYDLYPVWLYSPTRLNVADDPTREEPLREPAVCSFCEVDGVDLQVLHGVGLKRVGANWVRLLVLVLTFSRSDACSSGGTPNPFGCGLYASPYGLPGGFWSGVYDGFSCAFDPLGHFLLSPGGFVFVLRDLAHGWVLSLCGLARDLLFVCWVFCLMLTLGVLGMLFLSRLARRVRSLWLVCFCSLFLSPAPRYVGLDFHWGVLAMEPASVAERRRAAERAGILPKGDRVALEATRGRRRKLFRQFQVWLWQEKGISLLYLLREKPADPERLAYWLVQYGGALYQAGKAYGIYAETINSVAAERPQVRKQLVAAWDFAYSWVSEEPFSHHPALPASILLAMMAVSILWGWLTEAAIFGLMWAGILRVGEVLQASREDLVLPRDSAPGVRYALLKIKEPKTRGKHARHQAARVDPTDIVELLDLAFAKADPKAKLWPLSGSTLRKRFGDLMRVLKLPEGSMG